VKAWSVISLLFAAAVLASVPISPQVMPRGLEMSVGEGHHLWHYRRVNRRVYRRSYRYARRAYRRAYYGGLTYGGSTYYWD
jgi:hypothetical protein